MRVNHNISALNAWRNLFNNDNKLSKSMERLSSGLRINRASDDAAGLAISEKMRGQIRGLNQAVRNSQDGISLIQTAEGSLNETHSILQRMRELAVQAANDTLTASDRVEIQKEMDQLRTEIDRIANTTEFNTKKLLDGTTSALTSTDRLETRVFMRDGLRVEDQFGQKAAGGGNFKLEIEAKPGTAQIQKTDIFKVKHGAEVEAITEEDAGFAVAAFTGIGDMEAGDSVTFNIRVDGETHSATLTGVEGETSALATAINGSNLGDLITAYGRGSAEPDWIPPANAVGVGALIIAADSAIHGESFDFWISGDISGAGGVGTMDTEPTTYTPEDVFVTGVNMDETSMLEGSYQVDIGKLNDPGVSDEFMQYRQEGTGALITSMTSSADQNQNISLMLEVTGVDETANEVTVRYDYVVTDTGGQVIAESGGTRTLVTAGNLGDNNGESFGGYTFGSLDLAAASEFTEGDRIVINSRSHEGTPNDQQQVSLDRGDDTVMDYVFANDHFDSTTTSQDFRFYQLNETTGDWKQSEVTVNFSEATWRTIDLIGLRDYLNGTLENVANFTIEIQENIGQIAGQDTALRDIDRFWDASGNFLLDDPQTITLVQGDGNKASFTLFENDTIQDVVNKIDAAIRNERTNFAPGTIEAGKGLGQGALVGEGEGEFAYFVQEADVEGEQARVEGTIVINSAITGQQGEIQFVGDEDVIKALSLTNIRDSKENQFNITVTDAHSGDAIAENVQVTGNMLVGTVHTNVDVEFDPMANVGVKWQGEDGNAADNSWVFASESHSYETFVHLADNTMVFHIGANPLQDVAAGIGDMRARALGVHNVQVTDRDSANRAIAQIDSAIERVSAERSKMGALQNRLDHTINNLMVASENLTAAESRIRDVDMAAEMMEFTKNQILMQAGTSMLAQANMRPQSVLQLLG